MSRGEFEWLISLPADGSLPAGGVAPVVIQWLGDRHPAALLKDIGFSLVQLVGFHPQADEIAAWLDSIGFVGEFSVSPFQRLDPPGLTATIRTPGGDRTLSSL
jgi:hypothetical protein